MMTVRPAFRKWLRIVLPPLVLVFGWILWGNVEHGRYLRAVAAVEARMPQAGPALAVEDGSRFYAAAAVLADAPTALPPVQTAIAVRDALVTGKPVEPRMAQAARDTLRVNEPTFAVIDRAAQLELPGTVRQGNRAMVLRSVPAWGVMTPVMSLRTLDAIARGDGERAVGSLLSALRFLRGAAADTRSLSAIQQANVLRSLIADLTVLLQRCRLTDADLDQLDQVLARLMPSEELRRFILGQAEFRYSNVSVYVANGLYGDLIRPARYRVAAGIARSTLEALDVAEKPWPERVRGMARLSDWQVWLAPKELRVIGGDANRQTFQWLTENFAAGVATVNAARTAIAIERYRQAHGRWPAALSELGTAERSLDPFTGSSLLFRLRGDGYLVYSVGRDGRDDGGDVGPATNAVVPGALGKDLGIALAGPPATSSQPR